MLVTLDKAVEAARGKAVAAFDVLEEALLFPVVSTAERWGAPIALMVLSEDHDTDERKRWISTLIRAVAEKAKVPIAFHHDHAKTYDEVMQWLDLGVTSVMLDAHEEPIATNIARTQQVYEAALRYGASTECEVGEVAGAAQDGTLIGSGSLTEVADLVAMHQALHPSALIAVAVGQGHNTPAPPEGINFERLLELKDVAPGRGFVLHGGSGIPLEQIERAVREGGIRKLNIYAANREGFWQAVLQLDSKFIQSERPPGLRAFTDPIHCAIGQVVEKRLRVCGFSSPEKP